MPTTNRSVTRAATSRPPGCRRSRRRSRRRPGRAPASCTGVSQGSVTALLRGPRPCPWGDVSQCNRPSAHPQARPAGEDGMALGVEVVDRARCRHRHCVPDPSTSWQTGGAPSVPMALRQYAFRRQHGMRTLRLGQARPGRAMHLGVGGIEEEAEGVLDLPHDRLARAQGGGRGKRQHHRSDQHPADAPAAPIRIIARLLELQPRPASGHSVRCRRASAPRQSCHMRVSGETAALTAPASPSGRSGLADKARPRPKEGTPAEPDAANCHLFAAGGKCRAGPPHICATQRRDVAAESAPATTSSSFSLAAVRRDCGSGTRPCASAWGNS